MTGDLVQGRGPYEIWRNLGGNPVQPRPISNFSLASRAFRRPLLRGRPRHAGIFQKANQLSLRLWMHRACQT